MKEKKKFIILTLFVAAMLLLIPMQYAQAATADAADLKQLFKQLDNRKKWEPYKTNVDDSTIAWGHSYILRAYLYMYEATGDKQYLDEFVKHADSMLQRRDSVRGVKDYRGLSLPAWRSGKYAADYKIYAVQTGLTVTPLAQFAAVVKNKPALASYQTKANAYLKAAKDAIAIHDMRDTPKYMETNSKWIEDATTMYLDRPINMNLAQGSAMLAIYEATGDRLYLEKATKIANYFKKHLSVNKSSNGYQWPYYPDSRYGKLIEDINHSVYDIEFIYLAYRNGLFNQTDMQRFANTASKVLVKGNGTIANSFDGSGTASTPGWIANWLYFEPWAPSLFDVSYDILSAQKSVTPKELAGVALLNCVLAGKGVSDPGTGDPNPEPGDPNPDPNPDPGDGDANPQPKDNLIVNGDFSAGLKGWVNKDNVAVLQSSSTGNQFVVNGYNFGFYQELTNLEPGVYKINARTKKGTAERGARIVVQFRDRNDNKVTPYNFTYRNTGGIWETMPEMTIEVPPGTTVTRIYLSAGANDSGTQYFDDITLMPVENAVRPDTEAPRVSITLPAVDSQLEGAVALEATVSDNVEVSRVTFSYATDPQGPWTNIGAAALAQGTAGEGAWRLSWDTSALKDGAYYLMALVEDSSSNKAETKALSIGINNNPNFIVNGDFSAGLKGWVNKDNVAVLRSSSTGNQFVVNGYNFGFYQELTNLEPGVYKINARTKKGTAERGARIVVQFRDRNDNKVTPYNFTYRNTGGIWETMPEMTIEVPPGTTVTRIYLSAGANDSGTQYFDDITLVKQKS